MNIKHKILLTAAVLLLSGCITLPDPTPAKKEPPPPEMVKDSLSQICKEAKSNYIRASDLYRNKGMSIKGKVYRFNEFVIYIDVNNNVGASIQLKDPQAVKRISMGQTIYVTGVISSVSYTSAPYLDSGGACGISLKNATF